MLGVAEQSGYRLTDFPEEASVIVVNTCGFIEEAKKESIETIVELASWKQNGGCKKLIVTGCLSQRYPQELSAQMPEVDHFLGSSDMLRLKDVLQDRADRMLVGNPADWLISSADPRALTQSRVSAYIKIAEGCDRKCSFCAIPQFRGVQRSRDPQDILREAEHLISLGAVELNLISQDTLRYGHNLPSQKRIPLSKLVEQIANLTGVQWVRLFYLYPQKLEEELLELLAGHPHVVPYVDMPLQHAADPMLKRMKRGCGKDRQKRIVEQLRLAVPRLTFRTAFIVGHPGETQEEFEELYEFVQWARFEYAAVFRYSDEESCPSYQLESKVKPLVTANRQRRLVALQERIAREKNQAYLDQELDILVEGPSEEHKWVYQGRHAGQAPEIDGRVFLSGEAFIPGEIVRVQISQATTYDLVGETLYPPSSPVHTAKEKKKTKRRFLPLLPHKPTSPLNH
ncbi:ribosomal protein S12 methylthiotransferase RimO [Pajaroellobacter abortibovis]|uniref:Ribosomal protein uS12 methylthiotransferase RimO n=2 Tax=Pajaroellobacter abortibovis TaxID=1882918 RepID=A0A1L6MX77_9BACT|nr:ribosomal protein S12 methylthiotransferase RimO [Pajaroellobacter abortibovis]